MDKSRFRADRQFNCVRDLSDGWVSATTALLSQPECAQVSGDSGGQPADWRKAASHYRKSPHADVCAHCINTLLTAFDSVAGFLPDTPEIASLKLEKRGFEEDLSMFRSVYNEFAAAYNRRINFPVFRQCAAVLRKKPWEELRLGG